MDILTQIQNLSIPHNAWVVIAAGGVVSVFGQMIKHWLELQSDKVITFMLTALSFCAVGLNYVTQTVGSNPGLLGAKTAMVLGVSQIMYRFAVKPSYGIVKDAKEYRARKDRVTTSTTSTAGSTSVALPLPTTVSVGTSTPIAVEEFQA